MPGSEAARDGAAKIARLLQDGLERYGEDDVDGAVRAWQQVLELDPDNAEASDYLESAGALPAEGEGGGDAQEVVRGLLADAHQLVAAHDFEAAYDMLQAAAGAEEPVLEVEATLDLVRSQLIQRYRLEVGDPSAVPVVSADGPSLTGFNLPTEAGFLLSLVDGATPIQDMVSLSGLDSCEALRLLRGLLDAGIVEVPL